MSETKKLIEALRNELDHARSNGHALSEESQGVAPGEIVPAVRVSSIEAVIDRFEKAHTPTVDDRIRGAILAAVAEEFGGTYGGEEIADRAIAEMCRSDARVAKLEAKVEELENADIWYGDDL